MSLIDQVDNDDLEKEIYEGKFSGENTEEEEVDIIGDDKKKTNPSKKPAKKEESKPEREICCFCHTEKQKNGKCDCK